MANTINDDGLSIEREVNGSMVESGNSAKNASKNASGNVSETEEKVDSEEVKNLSKVRDILFGRDLEDIGGKLSRMELRLEDKLTEVSDKFSDKLNGLEKFFKGELDKVSLALTEEKGERIDRHEEMDSSLSNLKILLVDEVSRLQSERGQSQSDLENLISKETLEVQKQISNLEKSLSESMENLDNDKTSRRALARVLNDLADGLVSD